MAASAQVVISGYFSNTPTSAYRQIGPITLASAAANPTVLRVVLQAGENVITIPASPAPNGCIIQLPSDNTSVTKLVGTTGDVGFAIGKTTAHVLSWDPTAVPASFILSSVSTQTGKATEITFY